MTILHPPPCPSLQWAQNHQPQNLAPLRRGRATKGQELSGSNQHWAYSHSEVWALLFSMMSVSEVQWAAATQQLWKSGYQKVDLRAWIKKHYFSYMNVSYTEVTLKYLQGRYSFMWRIKLSFLCDTAVTHDIVVWWQQLHDCIVWLWFSEGAKFPIY